MSEFEKPQLAAAPGRLTIDEVRAISGAATPHFSLHIRNRLRRLIAPLPAGDPVRAYAEEEIVRVEALATELEHGPKYGSDLPTLRESQSRQPGEA